MLVLTIHTDKPEAELGLFDDDKQVAYETWQAHRELSNTIHNKLADLLKQQGKILHDLAGIVVFQGPGSFTGLRIGLAVANALAYGLDIPIVGTMNDDWIQQGIMRLLQHNDEVVLPEYGAAPHITQQKK